VADVIKRGHGAVGHQHRLLRKADVALDPRTERLEPNRRCINMEFLIPHAFDHRLENERMRRNVIRILADPLQTRRVHKLVEMGVTDFEASH